MSTFDFDALKQLLYDFYTLTNIKTCLYDSEGNELCYYPTKFSGFCEILRKDGKMDLRCKDCDKHAFAECRKTRRQYSYTCHAGLRECLSPIHYNNHIIGFMMIGQIKNNGADIAELERELPEYLRSKLRAAYDSLPTISEEKLISAFRVLDACTNYERLKTMVELYNDPIEAQIDKYIYENLSKPLSVSHLCSHFHLSHYEIYQICNEYFCATPAKHIKNCRLAYACKLLATTDFAVSKIALLCGIEDYNYFSKLFKATYGINPTDYRKNNIASSRVD